MEEKKQKKIKAAGLPANLAEASKDNPSPLPANYAGAPKDYLPRKFKTT